MRSIHAGALLLRLLQRPLLGLLLLSLSSLLIRFPIVDGGVVEDNGMISHRVMQWSGNDVGEWSDAEGDVGLSGRNDFAIFVAHLGDGEPAMHLVERLGLEDRVVDDIVIKGDFGRIPPRFLLLLWAAFILRAGVVEARLCALVRYAFAFSLGPGAGDGESRRLEWFIDTDTLLEAVHRLSV